MKNRTLKKMLTVVTVMAVTLTSCKKEEITPEDPNLEWGYWEVTALSPYIKVKALSGEGNRTEFLIPSGSKPVKLGYKVFHTVVISCTDAGGNPSSVNGCAFTVNGDFYNKGVRLERGVN